MMWACPQFRGSKFLAVTLCDPTAPSHLALTNVGLTKYLIEVVSIDLTEYLARIMAEPALFSSGFILTYSNNEFVMLVIPLEIIMRDDLGKIFAENLVEALGLCDTSFDVPSSCQNDVLLGDLITFRWDARFRAFAA